MRLLQCGGRQMTVTKLVRAILMSKSECAQTMFCCNREISLSLASSSQGNSKLHNSTLDPNDFSAHNLDSQLHVGIIPCLVVRFSFVRTHEGISASEPVKKIIALTWLMQCNY